MKQSTAISTPSQVPSAPSLLVAAIGIDLQQFRAHYTTAVS